LGGGFSWAKTFAGIYCWLVGLMRVPKFIYCRFTRLVAPAKK
jgi:hypothetical protein